MKQNSVVELTITDLNSDGDGVGRHGSQVVFVPSTVPGDRLTAKISYVKKQYAIGEMEQLLDASEHRVRPPCIVADKCGGCQWLHITAEYQAQAKVNQVKQALQRIAGLVDIPIEPLISSPEPLAYRNKATYPLRRSQTGQVQAGYYRKGSHQLINLNQCPIQDDRLNPFLKNIKQDIQTQGWSIYQEESHRGKLRHLALRIGHNTGEILLTLVSTANLPNLEEQAEKWLDDYPELVGVCLNENPNPGNVIFGEETYAIAGQDFITETFAGLTLNLRPETFFQVNTAAAESLLAQLFQQIQFQGDEILVDAYCGVGTFTLPFAQKVKQAIGIEIQDSAIAQAKINAKQNQITNAEFHTGAVETTLLQLGITPDILLLDPPRKGCNPQFLEAIGAINPRQIIYISCNPSTLARDLKHLCNEFGYHILWIQPADFFPQTPHVECAVLLERSPE